MEAVARRRAVVLATLFAVALVALPFLFWYDTWFGRRLGDRQIERYLNDDQKPRRMQHALVQIGERLGRGDRAVERWYPRIIELSRHTAVELRQTAAWIMGQDTHYPAFRQALVPMLEDPSPMVRRNAALALAAFRDSRARPELRSMLRSYTVYSPYAGRVQYRLKIAEYVNPGTLIARVGEAEVRSPLPGELRGLYEEDGADIKTGQRLVEISPDEAHVWEALRALVLVGDRFDIADVQRYARGAQGMSGRIQQQAALTLQALENRSR